MLADVFDPRRNSLNAIRLTLALSVIVSHAWPLNGRAGEPWFGGMKLGTWAVVGFFAISGYLITRSRLNGQPARSYWSARALRIFPGLVGVLLVVAFVFAPIAAAVRDKEWPLLSAATYVLRNVWLYPPHFGQLNVGSTLSGQPSRIWDGSLWTLFYEGACYVMVGVAPLLMRTRRALTVGLTIWFLAATLFAIAGSVVPLPGYEVMPFFIAFAAGGCLFLLRERVPVTKVTVAVAILLLVAALLFSAGRYLAPLPLAFLLLVLSTRLPLQKVGSKYDISYGVYIYAWATQQLVVVLFGSDLPLFLSMGSTLIGTLLLALLSCVAIERPALRLKSGTTGQGQVPAVVSAP